MRKFTFKNVLMVGTAIVAVGAFSAQAQAADVSAGGSGIWSSSGNNNDDGTLAEAEAGAALAITADGVTVTVTDDGTANDSGGAGSYTIGAVTDSSSAQNGAITVTSNVGGGDVAATFSSTVAIGGNFTVSNADAHNATVGATVAGASTIGGTLTLTNTEASVADTVALTLTGNATVTGATTLTGGGLAAGGTTTTLNVDGASNTFTGVVTLNGGAGNAANDAILTISGASTTFTNGIVLDDNAAVGDAVVNFDGGTAQTITGTINAAGATDEGEVNVLAGTNAVTFASQIGASGTNILALNIGSAAAGGNAVFSSDVYAATTTVLGEHADDASADFNGNIFGNLAVTTGGTAGDLASATVAGNVTGNITLDNGAGADVATLTFDGTTQTVTGDIIAGTNGDGLINVNSNVTVVGYVGNAGTAIGAVNVATGKTFTIQEAGTDNAINTTTLTGTGTLVYDTTNAGGDSTLTGAVAGAADGNGVLKFTGAHGAVVTGNVGASGTDIGAIQVTGLATGKSVTLQEDVYANGIAIDATAATDENTVTLGTGAGDTVAITGNITSAENGEHTLDFNAATAASVTGNIGASGAAFKQVTATESLTVTGDIYSTAITVDNTKTLTLNGAGSTIAGTVDGDGAGQGLVQVSNTSGLVTFTGKVGNTQQLADLGVSANANATFQDTIDTAIFDLDGTATVTVNDNVVSGTLDFADGSKIIIGSGVVTGETVFDGTGGVTTTTTGTDGQVTVNMPSNFTTGAIRFIHDSGAHGIDANDFVLVDTALVDYAFDTDGHATFDNDGNEVVITATAKSAATAASELSVTTKEATALTQANTALATGDATALTALSTALNAGGTEAKKAAQQVGIQADTLGASTAAIMGAGSQVMGVSSTRLASVRSGTQYASAGQTGFAAGGSAMSNSYWVKPFGNIIDQDSKDGIAGYEANTYGLAVGVDGVVAPDTRVGISGAYANTDVDGDGAGQSDTDIDSYQVTVYGDYTTDTYYVEGMVGYAYNESDTSRKITFGGLNRTAKGNYDSNQYMVSVKAGMPMHLQGETYITPTAGLAYTHVESDNYTETGAGNLNARVNPDDVDAFVASAGAKIHAVYEEEDGYWVPSAKLGVSYDFAGDEAAATGTFTGGGSAFTVEGAEVEQFAGNVGLGLAYDAGGWSLSANYDAEVKSDYLGHSASLEARFKF